MPFLGIMFVTTILGSYLGLKTTVAFIFYITLLLLLPFLTILSRNKKVKLVAILLTTLTASTFLSQINYRRALNRIDNIPEKMVIYECTAKNISEDHRHNKRMVLHVQAIEKAEYINPGPLKLSLILADGASLADINDGDIIRVWGKAKPIKHSLSPDQFDPFWYNLSRKIDGSLYIKNHAHIVNVERNTTIKESVDTILQRRPAMINKWKNII